MPSRPGRPIDRLPRELTITYHRSVARVAGRIDGKLGEEVFADRLGHGPLDDLGRRWLAAWRPARRAFLVRATELAGGRPVGHADVRDCFGSIHPAAVRSALLGLSCRPGDVREVVDSLTRASAHGARGLPVGPAASALLAHAVLVHADAGLRARGFRFLRWVDDYLIFAHDEPAIGEGIRTLRAALAEVGLRLAEEKTWIGSGPPVSVSRSAAAL